MWVMLSSRKGDSFCPFLACAGAGLCGGGPPVACRRLLFRRSPRSASRLARCGCCRRIHRIGAFLPHLRRGPGTSRHGSASHACVCQGAARNHRCGGPLSMTGEQRIFARSGAVAKNVVISLCLAGAAAPAAAAAASSAAWKARASDHRRLRVRNRWRPRRRPISSSSSSTDTTQAPRVADLAHEFGRHPNLVERAPRIDGSSRRPHQAGWWPLDLMKWQMAMT